MPHTSILHFAPEVADDTVRNIYAGAHCKAPTRMAGFNEDPEPYLIRTHHEADYGAVPQVLFRENQPATLWRLR